MKDKSNWRRRVVEFVDQLNFWIINDFEISRKWILSAFDRCESVETICLKSNDDFNNLNVWYSSFVILIDLLFEIW